MNNKQESRVWYCYRAGHSRFLDGPGYLGISQRAMERLVQSGRLGYTRLGRLTVFSREQLDAYITANTHDPVA